MTIVDSVLEEIKSTVGTLKPETGGILLGFPDDNIVRKFVFDSGGSGSIGAYDPDVDFLNEELKKARKEHGYELIGWTHSHPRGCSRLSGDMGNGIGDIGYLKRIFQAFPHLNQFYIPIIFSTESGNFKMHPYVAFRENVESYATAKLNIIKEKDIVPSLNQYKFNPSKLEGAVDYKLLQDSHVVCVGIGGANSICEYLTRTGLGKLTTIDFDCLY